MLMLWCLQTWHSCILDNFLISNCHTFWTRVFFDDDAGSKDITLEYSKNSVTPLYNV